MQLIPPWNDEGVEDGSGIFSREWGVDPHNEGGESNEEVKSPHVAEIYENTLSFGYKVFGYMVFSAIWSILSWSRTKWDFIQ